jgi:hypothetical protein
VAGVKSNSSVGAAWAEVLELFLSMTCVLQWFKNKEKNNNKNNYSNSKT